MLSGTSFDVIVAHQMIRVADASLDQLKEIGRLEAVLAESDVGTAALGPSKEVRHDPRELVPEW
jgi:hypothetical protein